MDEHHEPILMRIYYISVCFLAMGNEIIKIRRISFSFFRAHFDYCGKQNVGSDSTNQPISNLKIISHTNISHSDIQGSVDIKKRI